MTNISGIERLPDWRTRLIDDVLNPHADIEPQWGVSDCLMFCADAIKAQVGVDPLAQFRENYTTEQGAAKLMLKNGCENADDVFKTYLGLTPVDGFIREGDVATVLINGQVTAGVYYGPGFAIKVPSGLRYLSVGPGSFSDIQSYIGKYKVGQVPGWF